MAGRPGPGAPTPVCRASEGRASGDVFFFPHVLLGAKGPQKGRKGKMDSCQPYINAILNSKSWWKNLAEEQITPASKLAIRLFCLSTNLVGIY